MSNTNKTRRTRQLRVALMVLGVAASCAFVVIRPDLPPRTDLDTVLRLVESQAVGSLELRDDTLTVTKRNGDRLRLEGITTDQYRRLQPVEFRRLVVVSPANGLVSLAHGIAAVTLWLVPGVLGAVVLLGAKAILRWRPRRSARGS